MSERRNEDRAREAERNLIDVNCLNGGQALKKYRTDPDSRHADKRKNPG